MRIDSIYLREVGPFDDVRIDLPEGTNPNLADVYLLTGPNGCGKSTVLYAIADLILLSSGPLRERFRGTNSHAEISTPGLKRSWGDSTPAIQEFADGRPVGSLHPLDAHYVASMFQDRAPPLGWTAFAYAGTRQVVSGHVAAIAEQRDNPLANSLSFHHTANTANLAQWIANQDVKRLKAKDAGRHDRAAQLDRSVRDIERVVAKIIEDPTFKFEAGNDYDLDIRVRRHGGVVNMGVLPDGLKSIVSWVADLLMRLDRIRWVDDTPPMQRPFLLLLDEIDIHLHPAWQRNVIPIVQKLFPRAQIIASTHSPFVVASADDAHIITFAMKGGASTLASVKPSQTGRSYRAILQDIFGVTSEFDVDTEALFSDFYTAKTDLLQGKATDRAEVDRLARQLAQRGEEVEDIIGLELRQLERHLAKRAAG